MKVFIVRHGDREPGEFYNEKLRHQDSPISEVGHAKAKRLLDYFKHKQIEKIIISEYLRTDQTSKYVSEGLGLKVFKDKRLNEIDNGVIESLCDEEIMEKYPEFWRDFFSFSKDLRFPEGESGEEVKIRQKSLLDELILNNEDVLLVSHEGYIRLLMCHILDLPVYKRNLFKVDMCGITELEYDPSMNLWRIIKFNQTIDM